MAGAPPSGGFGALLESGLSNPLLQTALAAYLGFAGSPRRQGLGAAMSRGGLAGLGTFNEAEQLKQRIPLEQAQTQLAQTSVTAAKQRMHSQKQALDWLDNDPAAKKMDPQQRMVLRFGIATGKIDPAMLGLTPYQKAELDVGQQRLGLQQKRFGQEQQLGQQRLGLEQQRLGQEKTLGEERLGLEGQRLSQEQLGSGHVIIHSIADPTKTMEMPLPKGGVFEPPAGWEIGAGAHAPTPQNPQQQLSKINTDLGRFATTNPIHLWTRGKPWVDDAVKYAKNLNPGADEAQIRASAEALARTSGTGAPSPATATAAGPPPLGAGGATPSATSLSGRPIYTWPDGTHHYNPPPSGGPPGTLAGGTSITGG